MSKKNGRGRKGRDELYPPPVRPDWVLVVYVIARVVLELMRLLE